MTQLFPELPSRPSCAGKDPELWYPAAEPGTPMYDGEVARARAVCADCPIKAECLTLALETECPTRRWGVWAGTTPKQRAELHRVLARERVRDLPPAPAIPAPVVRPPRQDPTPGQIRGLLRGHDLGGRVPSTISASITASMVRDGLAQRCACRLVGRHTRLTEAGAKLAARLAGGHASTPSVAVPA